MYIHILFSHLRHEVYLRRNGRPTCTVFFTHSSICPTKASHILFCIDKARKRSFTEVALNSVLEENAVDFAWEFCWNFFRIFILQLNFFTNGIFVVFPNYLIGGSVQCNLIAYCGIARSAMRTLRSVCKKSSAWFLRSCTHWGALTIHRRALWHDSCTA